MAATRLLFPLTLVGATAALNLNSANKFLLNPIRRIYCESSTYSSWGFRSREPEPVVKREVKMRTGFSPALYRQISVGSFVGLAAGLAVSRYSKAIVLVVGSLLLLIEFLAAGDLHIIPYSYLQRWVRKADVKGLMMRNVAFKVSFGASFVLAALYG